VLIAEGVLIYLGPQGWFNRVLSLVGIGQVRLAHNYTGVMLSLILSGFPFAFLLTLSHLTGIDPSLEQAAATLGAKARSRFWHIIMPLLAQGLAINLCRSFVQTFSVFPSAVLHGAPAGATRVISIAAYQAAYEQYDASMASAIAMIMGFWQSAWSPSFSPRAASGTAAPPAAANVDGHEGGKVCLRAAVVHRHLGAGDLLHPELHSDDRHRRPEFVRHALVQRMAACRFHDALVRLGLG
jgi:hypothetical protein